MEGFWRIENGEQRLEIGDGLDRWTGMEYNITRIF
jgi:hypothetical protein